MPWILAALVALFLAGQKKVIEQMVKFSKQDFLKKAAAAALPTSKESGIPLSIIVTQAAHESNFGNSQLAQRSNNLFGIKASDDWSGLADDYPTREVVNGKEITVHALFRKYDSWDASVRDWFKFINKTRYGKALVAAKLGDAHAFFVELQKAGYATDPSYAAKLDTVMLSVRDAVV